MKKTTIFPIIVFFISAIIFGGFSHGSNVQPIEQVSAADHEGESKKQSVELPIMVEITPPTEFVIEKSDPAPKVVATPKQTIKPAAPAPPPPQSCESGSFYTQFLCLLNNYRKSKGLNALAYDSTLNAVATNHSTWMNINKTMNHIGDNGSTFDERCIAGGTVCDAENVAWNYTTAQKLFDAWKQSPSHNKNMLGAHAKTGLSLVGTYATILFR